MAGYGCGTGGLPVFLGHGRRKAELYEGNHMSLGATLVSDNGFDGRFAVSSDGNTALKLSAPLSFRALTTSNSAPETRSPGRFQSDPRRKEKGAPPERSAFCHSVSDRLSDGDRRCRHPRHRRPRRRAG